MTTQMPRNDFDRLMTSWLEADAQGPEPEGMLEQVLVRTRTARRLPAWRVTDRWIPRPLSAGVRILPRAAALLILVTLLLVAAAIVVIVSGSRHRLPAPFGPAANGLIAYDTNAAIYVAEADGSHVRPLVLDVPNAAGATFSPDGTKVAFWGDGSPDSLYLANADGTGVRKLVGDLWISTDKSPTWSPDSRLIALSTESRAFSTDEHLVVVDIVTGVASSIGPLPAIPVRALSPTWSPDGAWIAFEGRAPQPSYWVVRPDGRDARQLPSSQLLANDVPARWAPSATSLRLAYSANGAEPTDSDIYVFDLAANTETSIAPSPIAELWPTWSPDGTKLAWLAGPGPDEVRISPIADPASAVTLPATGIDFPPAWSPDGSRVYALNADRSAVVVISVDGSSPTVQIPHSRSQAVPDWQRLAP